MDESTDNKPEFERHLPPDQPAGRTPPPPVGDTPSHTTSGTIMSQAEEQQWAMFTHISALAGVLTGIGFIVGPLIMWLLRKDQSAYIDEHGKEAVNFQITMMIAAFISSLLIILLIGLPLLLVVILAMVILPIVAGLKAGKGESYRYPFTIRLIK